MTAGARLAVEDLGHRYGPRIALRGVSFALEPGAFLVVLGPNGAGKTTLLKALARLLRPTEGRILLDGAEWLDAPVARQREVGVLSHRTWLYDRLTALENLRFWGALYDLADVDRRAREALAAVGMEAVADVRVGELSRGQAQRVAIARALLHEPRLLLLDEPYAGLDPRAADALSRTLAKASGAGRTIVLTTHDLARVPAAATGALVLVDGGVAARTEPGAPATDALERLWARALGAA